MIRNLKDLIFEWNAFNTLVILSTLSLFYLLFITNPSYTSVPSGVWHYIIARYSYGNSDFELDVWAKPVFTIFAVYFFLFVLKVLHFIQIRCIFFINILILKMVSPFLRLSFSLLFFILGIMGEYKLNIFKEFLNRRSYIIKK